MYAHSGVFDLATGDMMAMMYTEQSSRRNYKINYTLMRSHDQGLMATLNGVIHYVHLCLLLDNITDVCIA